MMQPILIVAHGQEPAAAEFYGKAFAASLVRVHRLRNGTPFSYQLRIGEQVFGVSGANPRPHAGASEKTRPGPHAPAAPGEISCLMTLCVSDVARAAENAEAAGATVRVRPAMAAHGGMAASIVDPFGHLWNLYESAELTPSGQARPEHAGAEPQAA